MAQSTVRVLQTVEHRCGYYPDRSARNLVIDPNADHQEVIYDAVTASGFRRAGDLIFRPHCRNCNACHATRIPVERFQANRSQRRCRRRNADLRTRVAEARLTEENFRLYERYLNHRHPGGGMDNPGLADFENFLLSQWANTVFIEMRREERLLGIAVTDRLASGLSAVYSFYDPSWRDRSLGTFAILTQIAYARRLKLPFLYLGYWLPEHPKMTYKTRFRPIEIFTQGRWQPPPS